MANEVPQVALDPTKNWRELLRGRVQKAERVKGEPDVVAEALEVANNRLRQIEEAAAQSNVRDVRITEGRGTVIEGYEQAHDPLTRLPVVKSEVFRLAVLELIKELVINKGWVLNIAVADLSGLKRYNDDFGHEVADKFLLKYGFAMGEIAQGMKEYHRDGIIVIPLRMQGGGDEFIILILSPEVLGREFFDVFFAEPVPHAEINKAGQSQEEMMQAYYGLAHLERADLAELLAQQAQSNDKKLFENFRQKLALADNAAEEIKLERLMNKISARVDELKEVLEGEMNGVVKRKEVAFRQAVLKAIPEIRVLLEDFGSIRLTPEGMRKVLEFTRHLGVLEFKLQALEEYAAVHPDDVPEVLQLTTKDFVFLRMLSPEAAQDLEQKKATRVEEGAERQQKKIPWQKRLLGVFKGQ